MNWYGDVVAQSGDSHFAPEATYWRTVAQYSATHAVLGQSRPAPRLQLPPEFNNKEVSMATALIKGYEGDSISQFKDLYQERLHKIIEAQMGNRRRCTSAHNP